MLAEIFADQPFPGIELEEHLNGLVVEVAEAQPIPADILNGDARRLKARLHRSVAQIFNGANIFRMLFYSCEMHAAFAGPEILPRFDQTLVDGIELIAFRPG